MPRWGLIVVGQNIRHTHTHTHTHVHVHKYVPRCHSKVGAIKVKEVVCLDLTAQMQVNKSAFDTMTCVEMCQSVCVILLASVSINFTYKYYVYVIYEHIYGMAWQMRNYVYAMFEWQLIEACLLQCCRCLSRGRGQQYISMEGRRK